MSAPSKSARRRVGRIPPASGRKPKQRISQRDVALSAAELLNFHQHFAPLYTRREQRHWSLLYLCGQLANLERKTMEPMILALCGAVANVIRAVQQFIGQGQWASAAILAQVQYLVAAWLSEADGVVIVDGSGFPKQGQHSVGVAPQYCGHLGKIANCQQGVFLVYASRRGHAFLDAQLYMPADGFGTAYHARRQTCGVPATLTFRTEPQVGLAMIREVVARAQVPFQWVTCDEGYGKDPTFLDGIAALGKFYLAEVPSDTRVWVRTPPVEPPGPGLLGRPRLHARGAPNAPPPHELRELVKQIPRMAWHRRVLKEGSKGPLTVEFATRRVTAIRAGLPGPRQWAVFRRTLGAQSEVKFYLSNAPTTCAPPSLLRMCGMRWPIETALEEAKGEVGMDHYETRTWAGWHHHMAQTIMAHLFLVWLHLLFQKKFSAHCGPSTPIDCPGDSRRSGWVARYSQHPQLSATTKSCRVSLTSQTCSPQIGPCQAAKTQSLVVI